MAIQSLKKACKILSLFSLEKPRWGVSEIAKAIDLPITTASSLIRTLKGEGFLDQDSETRRYSLGSNIFTLETTLCRETQPMLHELEAGHFVACHFPG
jgi:IclR family KDG regulon transcriptional repressor